MRFNYDGIRSGLLNIYLMGLRKKNYNSCFKEMQFYDFSIANDGISFLVS